MRYVQLSWGSFQVVHALGLASWTSRVVKVLLGFVASTVCTLTFTFTPGTRVDAIVRAAAA